MHWEMSVVTCQSPRFFIIVHVLQIEIEAEEESPEDDFQEKRSQESFSVEYMYIDFISTF